MKKIIHKKLVTPLLVLIALLGIGGGVWAIIHRVNTSVQQVADTSTLSSTDPDIRISTVISDLVNPVAVAFPNQTAFFYGLRSGEVRGRLLATNEDWRLFVPSGIKNIDGFGLISLLADKEFSENRYMYACFAATNGLKVARYEIAQDLKSVVSAKDIISNIEASSSSDSSCTLNMDAVGTLWIGTAGSGIASAPQNPNSLAGKVLRINREGTGVGGNQKNPYDDRIFSYGHRKVTSIVFLGKLLDNSAYGYSIDQGGVNDELNYLKAGNFGFDPKASGNNYADAKMTDKSSYKDAIEALWDSSGSIGLNSAVLVKQNRWQAWQNKLLVTTKNKEMKIIEFDSSGAFKSEKTVLGEKSDRISNIFEAPDGTIYGTTDNGSSDKIIQIKVVCTVCG